MEKDITADELQTLKRPGLQKLAKKYGIKANLSNAKLIDELTLKLQHNGKQKTQGFPAETFSKNSSANVLSTTTRRSKRRSESDAGSNIDNSSKNLNMLNASNTEQKIKRSPNNTTKPVNNTSVNVLPAIISRSKKTSNNKARSRTPCSSKSKPGSKLSETSKTEQKMKRTPINTTNHLDTKTFSVPKSRSLARVNPASKKGLISIKRKSSFKNQQPQSAKRARRSPRIVQDDNARTNVISLIEQKVGHSSELRAFNKDFPTFAAKGVTIASSIPTPSSKKFTKVHEKNFEKMESIDDYEKRKRRRAEKLLGSNKKNQRLEQLSKPKTPKIVKPVTRAKPNFFSPKPKEQTPSGKAAKKSITFKPTVTKVSEINTNFTSNLSKLITPRKVAVSFAKTPDSKGNNLNTPATNKRITLPKRKFSTPFRHNTTIVNTPQSIKKNAFNLQESLKKPLTWKPHKGPLKQFEDTTKKPSLQERAKSIMQPKIASREKRRLEMKEFRSASRTERMMKRRGLK